MTDAACNEFSVRYLGGDPRIPNHKLGVSGKLVIGQDEVIFESFTWPDVAIVSVRLRRTFEHYHGYVRSEPDIVLNCIQRRMLDVERINAREPSIPAICMRIRDPNGVYLFLEVYFGVETEYHALVILKRFKATYPLVDCQIDDVYAKPSSDSDSDRPINPDDVVVEIVDDAEDESPDDE